ncbi:MAG TPA: hypothetical protein VM286_06330 [Candidatus Thermoplasmatota archaeon]|nr:hypothetical protein [Candidatus Thermoplasmatota archaeon]
MRAQLVLSSAALLMSLAALTMPAAAQGTGSGYSVTFTCPPTVVSSAAPSSAPDLGQQATVCPAPVPDYEDVMAQPVLVVGRDPSLLAFNALHGGSGIRAATQDPQPTPHSRDNLVHQPHTTFTTTDRGAIWKDNPYGSPLGTEHQSSPPLLPITPPTSTGPEVFGEDNAMVLDARGELTIASLYSMREERGAPVQYRIVAWDMGRLGDALDYARGYATIAPTDPDARVDSLRATDVPSVRETLLAWRETGADGKAWLQVAHRAQEDGGAQWALMDAGQRIGPCSGISNPLALDGVVYVACIAAKGYPGIGNIGQVQVHAIDPGNWTSRRVSAPPLVAVTSVALVSADGLRDGAMLAAGSGIREGRAVALVTAGIRGADWGRANDYGRDVSEASAHPGARLIEARINALAFVASSSTVHMVFMERFDVQGTGGQQEFAKTYDVAQASGRFLGKFPIAYGDPNNRPAFPPTTVGVTSEDFDDAHDSIVVSHDRSGKDRTFLAFGDYGNVRFAEVVEVGPPVPAFPPVGPVAAIPTLAASTSPVLVGAVAGTLSTAAVMRFALAKSKKSVEAPTL